MAVFANNQYWVGGSEKASKPDYVIIECSIITVITFIVTFIVSFASFLSGGFINMAVINPPGKKLAKRTSVHCTVS